MSEGERKYTGFAAIYQLEQEKLKREKMPAELPQPAPPPAESVSPSSITDSNETPYNKYSENRLEKSSAGSSVDFKPVAASSTSPSPIPIAVRRAPEERKKHLDRISKPKSAIASSLRLDSDDAGSVAPHIQRWKQVYRLNKGEMNVMKAMFKLSHEVGISECYIKIPEVAESAQLKKRQCQYVVRSLEELGFLERLEEYDPSNRRGIKYRVNLKPSHRDID